MWGGGTGVFLGAIRFNISIGDALTLVVVAGVG